MSHILLLPFGTSGSVFPFIWLGRNLVAREHRVTMVASPIYQQVASAAGIAFVPTETDELSEMLKDAGLWREETCKKVAFIYGGRAIGPCVAAIDRVIREQGKPNLMLAPMISFGARIAREKHGIPVISVHMYPAAMMSADDTPIIFPAVRLLRRLPLPLRKFILSLPSPYDRHALPAVIQACADHGVKPPKRLWKEWHHSPDGVLALFPDWFGGVKRDQPHNTFQWDFPLEDMAHDRPMDPDLEKFLDEGEKPILFTAGTGQFHASDFFKTAARVVKQLGCRAVFLTTKPEQVPADLPDTIFVSRYAPFSLLLPRAAAMVHHGGIGTTSQCLAAGIPQLVVFMALDQPDNAARVQRLGVGLSIRSGNLTAELLLPLAKRCLTDERIKTGVAHHADLMKKRPSLTPMIAWLEETIERGLS
ncbi:MAG: nucleotide disphospho-sugar-binding domain-containing protein [Luteolibacter sp.]|uniref:glycosyltransferase n=1 Tax=Luteolibacter sp. TaxID=1962973 RepID=UPI0032669084